MSTDAGERPDEPHDKIPDNSRPSSDSGRGAELDPPMVVDAVASTDKPASSSPKTARARELLELAGRALDPNVLPSGASPVLAARLLGDAAVEACAALHPDKAPIGAADVADTLGATVLKDLAGSADKGRSTLTMLADVPAREPSAQELGSAELLVTRLVELSEGRRNMERAIVRRRWALVVFGVAALLAIATIIGLDYANRPASQSYRWKASSSTLGFPTEGKLGDRQAYELVFHTAHEKSPWVEIDLGSMKEASQVILAARIDCCRERGLPLLVEVAGEDKKFEKVGKKEKKFDTWVVKFARRPIRYVRLSSPKKTILHMRHVDIR